MVRKFSDQGKSIETQSKQAPSQQDTHIQNNIFQVLLNISRQQLHFWHKITDHLNSKRHNLHIYRGMELLHSLICLATSHNYAAYYKTK